MVLKCSFVSLSVGDEPVKCDMMEQKEIEGGYKDEHCGRDAPENMAGICQ